MFSYISLEERVPARHPLRKLRAVVDALLAGMSAEFEAVHARRGRPSVPPEMLLKALRLPILFSIRSERLFNEDLARVFFERVKHSAGWAKLTGDEHFSVDGTLMEAWASHKSFKRKVRRLTVGADNGYDGKALIEGCRKLGMTPHVAAKAQHSAMDGRSRRHEGDKTSLRV